MDYERLILEYGPLCITTIIAVITAHRWVIAPRIEKEKRILRLLCDEVIPQLEYCNSDIENFNRNPTGLIRLWEIKKNEYYLDMPKKLKDKLSRLCDVSLKEYDLWWNIVFRVLTLKIREKAYRKFWNVKGQYGGVWNVGSSSFYTIYDAVTYVMTGYNYFGGCDDGSFIKNFFRKGKIDYNDLNNYLSLKSIRKFIDTVKEMDESSLNDFLNEIGGLEIEEYARFNKVRKETMVNIRDVINDFKHWRRRLLAWYKPNKHLVFLFS